MHTPAARCIPDLRRAATRSRPPCIDAPQRPARSRHGAHRTQRGFTALELLVVFTIVALLLGMAVPSFRGSIERTQVGDTTSEFANDLKLARSAAMTTGRFVSICASTDGSTCATGSGWNAGRLIYIGDSATTSPANTAIVKKSDAASGPTLADTTSGTSPVLSFNRNGLLTGGAERVLRISSASGLTTRCLTISVTGLTTAAPCAT